MRTLWIGEALLAALTVIWLLRAMPHSVRRYPAALGRMLRGAAGEVRFETRAYRAAFVAVGVVAVALRLYHVNQPIRYDEAWTYLLYASQSLWTALSDYSAPNNHVFHSLLAWISTRLLGAAPWTLRLPALLAGLALVFGVYLAARRLAGREAGLVAMALAASSPILVLYSTNARGYVMISLAFVVLLLLGTMILERDEPELWVLSGVVTALGLYTAPVMLYPAGAVSIWLLVERYRAAGVRGVLAMLPRMIAMGLVAAVITVAAYSPVVARQGAGAILHNRFVVALTWPQFVAGLPDFARTLRESLAMGRSLAVIGLMALAALASLASRDSNRRGRVTLALAVAAWCAVVLVGTRRPPPARVWLFLVPLAYLYVAAGAGYALAAAGRRFGVGSGGLTGAVSLALALAVSGQIVAQRLVVDSDETDWLGTRNGPAVVEYLRTELRPGDELVYGGIGAALDYYLRLRAGRTLREFRRDSGAVRAVVVVNEAHQQTPAMLLQRRRTVRLEEGAPLQLLRRVGRIAIYSAPARIVPAQSSDLPSGVVGIR
jgi:hypothetical protein